MNEVESMKVIVMAVGLIWWKKRVDEWSTVGESLMERSFRGFGGRRQCGCLICLNRISPDVFETGREVI